MEICWVFNRLTLDPKSGEAEGAYKSAVSGLYCSGGYMALFASVKGEANTGSEA